MKVILKEEDRIADVSDGYARNYLLPKKLAVPATPKALLAHKARQDEREKKEAQAKAEAEGLKQKIESAEILIQADAGEEGKLFGSITSADISDELKKTLGLEIDKKKIILEENLKQVGEYTAMVKLVKDVKAQLKIRVEPMQK